MIRYELFILRSSESFIDLHSTNHAFLTNYLDALKKNYDIKKINETPDSGDIEISPRDRYDISSICFYLTKMLCNDGWEPYQNDIGCAYFKLKYEN